MKTQYFTATSLDGFLATEDDSLDWLFTLGSLEESSYPAFIAQVGALAMGSSTYEWMLRNADAVRAETGSAWPYTQPAWVFSSRHLWVVGGGDLAGQFYDAGLLDELILQVGSVTLGRGKPLFPRRLPSTALRLLDAQPLGTGMVELRYAVNRTSDPADLDRE
ncbi:dihydrofolate reductase [Diaphorobacter sp. DS2]|nr:dihydrofolate reductase [Diaphorobacter sp. DS2]